MVLTVSSALSLVTGLSCHHRLADTSATLDASVGASGPHDFAVSNSAIRLARYSPAWHCHVHRIPRPTSVTIAIRPSCGCGITMDGEVICGEGKRKYFCKGGLDTDLPICPSGAISRPAVLNRGQQTSDP